MSMYTKRPALAQVQQNYFSVSWSSTFRWYAVCAYNKWSFAFPFALNEITKMNILFWEENLFALKSIKCDSNGFPKPEYQRIYIHLFCFNVFLSFLVLFRKRLHFFQICRVNLKVYFEMLGIFAWNLIHSFDEIIWVDVFWTTRSSWIIIEKAQFKESK